jgi:hypothetical protein
MDAGLMGNACSTRSRGEAASGTGLRKRLDSWRVRSTLEYPALPVRCRGGGGGIRLSRKSKVCADGMDRSREAGAEK